MPPVLYQEKGHYVKMVCLLCSARGRDLRRHQEDLMATREEIEQQIEAIPDPQTRALVKARFDQWFLDDRCVCCGRVRPWFARAFCPTCLAGLTNSAGDVCETTQERK